MDLGSEARDSRYDVVVIGSGLGGLSAAALLAKEGWRVLVAEQAEAPGGYAHAFRRGPYVFDPAIHVISQTQEGNLPDLMLRHLGVRDRVTFLPIDAFYDAYFPDGKFRAPHYTDDFIAAHARKFPEEADACRRFFQLCRQVHYEAHHLPAQVALKDLDAIVARYPTLFKYQQATLGEVLDEHFSDPRAKATASAIWPYVGLPPSRLSFLVFTQALSVQLDGTVFCQGSFQSLVDAFVAALQQNGGELALRRRVRRILLEDGRAAGVTFEDGREVRAQVVISNADARQTFEEMLGTEHLPAPFVRRLNRMEPALSAVVLFVATSLDLRQSDAAHETFIYKWWDHEETYRDMLEGRPGGMWVNVPTLIDPSLAPAGEHLLIMTALTPYDIGSPWEQEKERFTRTMLDELERLFPGLRENLTFVETATPRALEGYTLNWEGAAYGWANTPQQVASKRLSHATPVPGLYLSGHWTQPGSTSLRVLVSGLHTAFMILHEAGAAIPDIRPLDDMPPAF